MRHMVPAYTIPAMWTALLLLGCVHRVPIQSLPAGATVTWNGEEVGRAPVEVEVRPFRPRELEVTLPGYRPAVLRLSRTGPMSFVAEAVTLRWFRATGLVPWHTVEVTLVREHGGIGTWDAEDLE